MRSLLVASVAVAVVLGSVAGCSSSSPANPDAGDGLGFTITEQIFIQTPVLTYVFLSDRPGLCELINAGVYIKSANILSLGLVNVDSPTSVAPAIPGTYNLVDTVPGAVGLYLYNTGVTSNDATCTGFASGPSTGSVNLASISAVDGGTAVGSYGMFFGLTHVQGSFDASFCNYTYVSLPDAGWADGGGTPPCL